MSRVFIAGAVIPLILIANLCLADKTTRAELLSQSQSSQVDESVKTIIYPGPIVPGDDRSHYPIEVLKLALSYSDTRYQIVLSDNEMLQRRALTQLARGEGIDVAGSMTSVDREEVLLPIRIPVYKGLIGWRLAIINRHTPAILESVKNLRQLKGLVAGQVHDWPDTFILKSNGLKVHAGSNYPGLFKMLSQKRIDYYPRSVIEIWRELDGGNYKELMVDPYVLIYYPAAFYFFVNKENQNLADDIQSGLEMILRNGKFDDLFYAEHGDFLQRMNIGSRRVIHLRNDALPEKTPLLRRELWYSMPADQTPQWTAD